MPSSYWPGYLPLWRYVPTFSIREPRRKTTCSSPSQHGSRDCFSSFFQISNPAFSVPTIPSSLQMLVSSTVLSPSPPFGISWSKKGSISETYRRMMRTTRSFSICPLSKGCESCSSIRGYDRTPSFHPANILQAMILHHAKLDILEYSDRQINWLESAFLWQSYRASVVIQQFMILCTPATLYVMLYFNNCKPFCVFCVTVNILFTPRPAP